MSDNNEKKYIYLMIVKTPIDLTEEKRKEIEKTHSGTDIIFHWIVNPDRDFSVDFWTNDPEMKMHKLS